MRLFLKGRRNSIDAVAEFDVKNRKFTVLKGSHVSPSVSDSSKFRGAKTVLVLRSKYVKDAITVQDVSFRSPSSAANFVTGTSTNGLKTWKNNESVILKKILEL